MILPPSCSLAHGMRAMMLGSTAYRTALVRELKRYGQGFTTSEGRLDGGLAKYQIKVSPEKMHDLMYYTTLRYGESATMA